MFESISYIGSQTNEDNKTNSYVNTHDDFEFKISKIRIEPKNMENIRKFATFINLPFDRNYKMRKKSNSPSSISKIKIRILKK